MMQWSNKESLPFTVTGGAIDISVKGSPNKKYGHRQGIKREDALQLIQDLIDNELLPMFKAKGSDYANPEVTGDEVAAFKQAGVVRPF